MARKMKDSGIEWIGEIPEGWEVSKLKYLGRYVNGYPFKPDDWGDKGKPIIRIQDLTGSNDSPNYYDGDIDAKYHIKNGDILVSWAATLDAFIWNKGDGLLNQHIFKAIPQEKKITSHFFFWMIKEAMQNMNNDNKHGIFMQHVTLDVFNNFSVPLPPLFEQKQIATYLFQKISEADIMLDAILSSITGYKKLKQSVITQAVTKGVRGEREMKPTVFTRWSEIPFDWDLKRVKSCVASITSGLSAVTDDANSEESGNFVLRTSAVSSGFFIPTEVKPVLKSAVNRLICPVEPDTLIVSRMNTASMVGACAYVANKHPYIFLPDKLWKIKFHPSYHTKYMWYALNSVPAKSWFSELATGASSSMQNISINDFTSNYLPIPAFSEQKEIANYLDAKCAEIDKLIAKKEQLVKELESYKKSLIYEVVTGKREV